MAIISFNTFSSDKVVELLKKENEELKNKIETNNELIKLRNTNSIKTKMTESDLSKNSETKYNLFLGAEAVNWGEDLEQNVPTIGFGYFVTKNISLNYSYGRFDLPNYPSSGISTITNINNAFVKYTYKNDWSGLNINPIFGYVHYNVSSPDAGNAEDSDLAKLEELKIEDIESRSGFISGFEIQKEFDNKWYTSLRADFVKSVSIFGGIQF